MARFFLFISVLFFFYSQAFAQNDLWIRNSIDLTINTRFSEAESLLTKRIKNGDNSAAVYFYYASVLNSKMTHFENNADEDLFYSVIDSVIEKCENTLSDFSGDVHLKAKTQFYMGSAYGYLGFYQGKNGSWVGALKNGKKAYEYLEKSIKTDSTLWDAYLGIGVYKYWLSSKIDWLPLIPDNRQQGINLINKTIANDGYSKYMAMHQLVYILLDYGDFEGAKEIAEELVKKYPESQFMRWAHSHVYMKEKNFPEAIKSYKILLDLIEDDPRANPAHKITCLARMADMYARSDSCSVSQKLKQQIITDLNFGKIKERDEVDRLINEIDDACKNSATKN